MKGHGTFERRLFTRTAVGRLIPLKCFQTLSDKGYRPSGTTTMVIHRTTTAAVSPGPQSHAHLNGDKNTSTGGILGYWVCLLLIVGEQSQIQHRVQHNSRLPTAPLLPSINLMYPLFFPPSLLYISILEQNRRLRR